MIIKDINTLPFFTAKDGSRLSEILHPLKDPYINLHYSLTYAEIKGNKQSTHYQLRHSTEIYIILVGSETMHING